MRSTTGLESPGAASEIIWKVVTDAETLDDVCRGFVFTEWADSVCYGAFIYSLDQNLDLTFEAGFGRKRDEVRVLLEETEFADLDRILRDKTACIRSVEDTSFVCVPLIRLRVPIGLIVFVGRLSTGLEGSDNALRQISQTVGFSLAVFRLQNQRTPGPANRAGSQEALAPRQLSILAEISNGLTNRQIASKMMVSESTVRHETMRIYNYFNVGGRQEAITVARGAGYLV